MFLRNFLQQTLFVLALAFVFSPATVWAQGGGDCFDGCFDDDGNLIPPGGGGGNGGGSTDPNDPNDGNPPGGGEGNNGGGTDPNDPNDGDGGNDGNDGGNGDDNSGGDNGDDNSGGDNGGDDQNGDDDSAGNDDENSNGGQKNPPKKKKEKLTSKLEPMLYLDYDAFEKHTNLTNHDFNFIPQNEGDYHDFDSNLQSLIYGDYSAGLQVTKYHRLRYGVGGRVRWHYDNADGIKGDVWASIGIVPVWNEEVLSTHYVTSPLEISLLPSFKEAPESLSDLETWVIGDRLSFVKSGGVIFTARVGYKFISVGTSVLNEGQWRINVEKYDEDWVILNLQNIDLVKSSVSLNGTLVSLSQSQVETEGVSFTFKLRSDSEEARKAYEDLVNGNIAGVQKFAKENNSKDIVHIEDYEMAENGSVGHLFIGFPILVNAFWGSGHYNGVVKKNMRVKGDLLTANYAIYREDEGYNFFDAKKNHSLMFYAAHFARKNAKGVLSNGYFGEFQFSLQRLMSSSKKLVEDLEKLNNLMSLNNELKINVQEREDTNHNEARVRIKLNNDVISGLVDLAKPDVYKENLKDALNKIEHNQDSPEWDRRSKDQKRQDKRLAEAPIKNMFKKLKKMGKYYEDQPKKFVKAFAKFADYALERSSTFELFMDMIGENLKVDFHLRGAQFSQYSLRLTSLGAGKGFEIEPIKGSLKAPSSQRWSIQGISPLGLHPALVEVID